jgi:hypothetical protein
MHGRILKGVLSLLVTFFASAAANAQTIGTSARHMKKGEVRTLFYFQGTQDQHLKFNVGDGGTCTPGNQVSPNPSFPCGGSTKVSGEGSGDALLMKIIFQPHETGMQYYITAGAGNYALKVDSVTVINTLTGRNPGFLFGGGIKAVIWPDTLETPAIAFDLSLMHQRYFFDELRPALTAAQGQINEKLDILTVQAAMEISKRFKIEERVSLEPYGGVKVHRSHARLTDNITGQRHGGVQTTATPFVGLNVPIYEKEALFAEASFINGIQYAAGLSLSFG